VGGEGCLRQVGGRDSDGKEKHSPLEEGSTATGGKGPGIYTIGLKKKRAANSMQRKEGGGFTVEGSHDNGRSRSRSDAEAPWPGKRRIQGRAGGTAGTGGGK